MFNFSTTAYHVGDWLKQEAAKTYKSSEVEDWINQHECLAVCRDIANGNKHRRITNEKSVARQIVQQTDISAISTFTLTDLRDITEDAWHSQARFNLKVMLKDGSRLRALPWAQDVIDAWEQFMSQHGL